MSRCSPCFNDFGRFQEEAKRGQRRHGLAVAATILLVVGLAILAWTQRGRFGRQGAAEVAALDLTHRGILRGEEAGAPKPPLQLTRNRLELTVYLPVGSQPGTYELQILKQAGTTVWSGTSQAKIENNSATLHLTVDLTGAKRGQYFLAVRPRGWDWAFYPLVID